MDLKFVVVTAVHARYQDAYSEKDGIIMRLVKHLQRVIIERNLYIQ